MLTVDEILRLDTLSSGRQGAAMAHLRQHQRDAQRSTYGWQQVAFLREVRDSAQRRQGRTRVLHPGEVARQGREGSRGRRVPRPDGSGTEDSSTEELSGADLLWLQRLPEDPAAVTFDDAVRLARMADSINASTAPASAMLVKSLWEPIKDLHDEAGARDELARVREPGRISQAAQQAVIEVLEATHDFHSPSEALAVARERIRNFEAEQVEQYDVARERLQRRLELLKQARLERSATSRSVTS